MPMYVLLPFPSHLLPPPPDDFSYPSLPLSSCGQRMPKSPPSCGLPTTTPPSLMAAGVLVDRPSSTPPV